MAAEFRENKGPWLLSTVNGLFKGTKTMAKKAYDVKSLENRLRAYKKEENELYAKLGRLFYARRGETARPPESAADEQFGGVCRDIDNVIYRIRKLEKQISEVRHSDGGTDAKKPPAEDFDKISAEYSKKLFKKGNELVIIRTDSGIQLMRVCPLCQAKNPSSAEFCEKCGHFFTRS